MPEFTEEDDAYLIVRRLAAHCAAHGLQASLEGYRVVRIALDDVTCSCDARGQRTGRKRLHEHLHEARGLERQCRILMAGALAESMFSPLPAESALARRDRDQARDLLVELCGTATAAIEAALLAQVRASLSDHSWSMAMLTQRLLKAGTLNEDEIRSALRSAETSR